MKIYGPGESKLFYELFKSSRDTCKQLNNLRIAALDPGTQKAGIAVSDIQLCSAIPIGGFRFRTVSSSIIIDKHDVELLNEIKSRKIKFWVVGQPLELNGNSGDRVSQTIDFLRQLKTSGALEFEACLLQDERYSTILARADNHDLGQGLMNLDALSAARILQEFIGAYQSWLRNII